jgi:hypothetical protein
MDRPPSGKKLYDLSLKNVFKHKESDRYGNQSRKKTLKKGICDRFTSGAVQPEHSRVYGGCNQPDDGIQNDQKKGLVEQFAAGGRDHFHVNRFAVALAVQKLPDRPLINQHDHRWKNE